MLNSPFQTWAEVLSSVGLKAEINKNHGCINCPQPKGSLYQLTNKYMVRCLSVSVYAPIELVWSHIYMSRVFKFHTRASSIPMNWSHSSLKWQTFIILCMLMVKDSFECIQCEFLAFFWLCLQFLSFLHIRQLCTGECLNYFPFNLNSWKYDSNAIPVWNMRRRR